MFSSNDSLEPKDLRLLRSVLEDVCRERRIEVSHPEAQPLARELTDWYLFGVKHPDQLKEMLKPL
ncbi:hypothetical protein [Neorhizobium alkalisoli]|uniref:hypothetical protein n=1 Tax=Neorhizobium alkalisoli TaxID=528178 RepID=UPI0011A3F114|nr:hypothetical protein [Neorhizobium alkalisoli]